MIGAVRGIDPETGHYYDDTKRYIEASKILSHEDRHQIYEGNAPRVHASGHRAQTERQMIMSMNPLGVVKRNIVRADKAAVEKLSRFGVATLHEAMGRVGLMKPYMRAVYPSAPLRHGRDDFAAARRQLDDACGGRAVAARRCGRGRLHHRQFRWFWRPAGHLVPGTRCQGADY